MEGADSEHADVPTVKVYKLLTPHVYINRYNHHPLGAIEVEHRIRYYVTSDPTELEETKWIGECELVSDTLTPRLSNLREWENIETFTQMLVHGVMEVRGGEYSELFMCDRKRRELQSAIAKAAHVCPWCGYDGEHQIMVTQHGGWGCPRAENMSIPENRRRARWLRECFPSFESRPKRPSYVPIMLDIIREVDEVEQALPPKKRKYVDIE